MLVQRDHIIDYIPQRAPIVMVHNLLACGDNATTTSFTVEETSIFYSNGRLSESGLVENIAQTAAAGVGYGCKLENRPVPIGFIAAIKDLQVHALPQLGDELRTEVVVKNEVMDVTIIEGTIRVKEQVMASCEMRIFLQKTNQ